MVKVKTIIEFESIFRATNELKYHIGSTQPKISLEEISNGIKKFENVPMDQKVEENKFGPLKFKILETL